MIRSIKYIILLILTMVHSGFGWGSVGHKIVNRNAVMHLPPSMELFIQQQAFFESHASDADYRKSSDPTEGIKHYLDMENFTFYKQWIPRSLDSIKAVFGQSFIDGTGILPWATLWAMDSLTAQLRRSDWTKAYQTAADIGHYVGDGCQPLHATRNYDGQYSGNKGIHSRYESSMISRYESSLTFKKEQVTFIDDVLEYVFAYLYASNAFVDSIMAADTKAKLASGWNGSGTPPSSYYTALWEQTDSLTNLQMQNATIFLANMWYTAWVNAGLITPTSVKKNNDQGLGSFILKNNFPNPFNPKTTIPFTIQQHQRVRADLYTIDGRYVMTIVDRDFPAGAHEIALETGSIASGTYLIRYSTQGTVRSSRVTLIK